MPKRAKSICRQASCGALVDSPGFCIKHKRDRQQEDAVQRGTAHERGYTSAWSKARSFYLRKHSLCVRCQGVGNVVAATVVDHIIPHKLKDALDSGNIEAIAKARALFWDSVENWQSLCKPHHDAKTVLEDGGFGRAPMAQRDK
ncbi:HNH endonuclease [Glaciimonas sp. PCH181]|uniref:HNH endonuclease n=1 Tax=Glaciimonas sp. PCH181 TaxID=2133943 RepID=UPI00191BDD9B|nr:HNH endonuclease signature motif containing protein [Glaciimonas sp. PCH181]